MIVEEFNLVVDETIASQKSLQKQLERLNAECQVLSMMLDQPPLEQVVGRAYTLKKRLFALSKRLLYINSRLPKIKTKYESKYK